MKAVDVREVYVTTEGDPSTGIPGESLTISSVSGEDFLGLSGLEAEDRHRAMEDFRHSLGALFTDALGEPARVVFDFETEDVLTSEQAERFQELMQERSGFLCEQATVIPVETTTAPAVSLSDAITHAEAVDDLDEIMGICGLPRELLKGGSPNEAAARAVLATVDGPKVEPTLEDVQRLAASVMEKNAGHGPGRVRMLRAGVQNQAGGGYVSEVRLWAPSIRTACLMASLVHPDVPPCLWEVDGQRQAHAMELKLSLLSMSLHGRAREQRQALVESVRVLNGAVNVVP